MQLRNWGFHSGFSLRHSDSWRLFVRPRGFCFVIWYLAPSKLHTSETCAAFLADWSPTKFRQRPPLSLSANFAGGRPLARTLLKVRQHNLLTVARNNAVLQGAYSWRWIVSRCIEERRRNRSFWAAERQIYIIQGEVRACGLCSVLPQVAIYFSTVFS